MNIIKTIVLGLFGLAAISIAALIIAATILVPFTLWIFLPLVFKWASAVIGILGMAYFCGKDMQKK